MNRIAVGIPCYNRVDYDKLFDSLYSQRGIEVALYLMPNSLQASEECKRWKRYGATVFDCKQNTGVARSWNMLAEAAFIENHAGILLLHDDCLIKRDTCLSDAFAIMQKWPKNVYKVDDFVAILYSKWVKKAVGFFDEGFWPVGFETADFVRRCNVIGITLVDWHGSDIVHSKSTPNAYQLRLKDTTNLLNKERCSWKWGGKAGKEKLKAPFEGLPWSGDRLFNDYMWASVSNPPKFALITGLPRSGTSLVAAFLNSAFNASVLLEPGNSCRRDGFFRMDKLGYPDGESRTYGGKSNIIPALQTSGYGLIGVKEVFEAPNGTKGGWFFNYALPHSDLILCVLRDPIQTFASQLPVIRSTVRRSYRLMWRFVRWMDQYPNVRFISFDQFLADPMETINRVAGDVFSLRGRCCLEPVHGFGDHRVLSNVGWQQPKWREPGQWAKAVESEFGGWFRERIAAAETLDYRKEAGIMRILSDGAFLIR